ncbi:MAG: type IV toxin-antitoxin system AbiEi family antitoxin domain-containing protein [Micromonosporaceae bacterium]
MADKLPDRARRLLSHQRGVIAYWQAAPVGLSPRTIENFVRYGRWQRLQRGVYAGFTGKPSREAQLWAAVLRAPHAILSHESAAELDGLADRPSEPLHLTVPVNQHWRPVPGIVIHRSRRIEQARHPGLDPPRTMIEETVLDLAEAAPVFDDAFAWIARACQRGLTTPTLLRIRMDLRNKMRWRGELNQALTDVDAGVHSVLEHRYVRDVERAHRLPPAQRQAPAQTRGRTVYRDVLYRQYGVAVELDGRAYHPADERWHDSRRDNSAAADGIITLRYGWADVTQRPCEVALQVSAVLQRRGWTAHPRPCGPACPAKP